MTLNRPLWRWLVPLLAVVVVTTAGSAVATITRSTHGTLPPRTAAQLLVDVQRAQLEGFSGTVVQSADLGLPSLPTGIGDQSSNFSSLVSGSHTLRVWSSGAQQVRVALLGQLGESDLIRNGSDVWLWSSHDNAAHHLTVPTRQGSGAGGPMGDPTEHPMTPQQAADAALSAITPTTRVSTDRTAVVAGRSAYELILRPREAATLIGSVKIAIDGTTHIPLRVQVVARGATKPAFEIGFTSFDPSTPSASEFRFNPPPGATVTQGTLGGADHGMGSGGAAGSSSQGAAGSPGAAGPRLVGEGWTAVVEAALPVPAGGAQGRPGAADSALGSFADVVKSLPVVSGTWGSGHLLRGTLFSALLTTDGRLVAGAVPPAQLYAALASR
jgi:hypothetical protein